MIKIFVLIHLFCFLNGLKVFGQYDLPTTEKKIMDVIKSDTAIFFTCFAYNREIKEHVNGLGDRNVLSKGYVFYCTNGNFYSRQFMDVGLDDGSDIKNIISQAIKMEDKELFDFVKNNFTAISKENIRPFIYQYHDLKSNTLIYEVLQISHSDGKNILINLGNQHKYAEINDLHLHPKETLQNRLNLNFEYNNQTKIKSLYEMANKLVADLDNRYQYGM